MLFNYSLGDNPNENKKLLIKASFVCAFAFLFLGTGIRNVSVSIVGANGVSRTIQTNSFGNYRFDAIASGENYVVSVSNKKYTFANPTRVLSVQENVTDADFVAESSK